MSVIAQLSHVGNRLLDLIPQQEYAHLHHQLENTQLRAGLVIYESSERLDFVYFPTTAIVSLLYTMEDGSTSEMGLVGSDGLIGIALLLGGETTPNRAVIQIGGRALRMKAKAFREEFDRGGQLRPLLLRYAQALMTQIAQTAVCNCFHTIEQRLCRWLLQCDDRLRKNDFSVTQECISNILGVRRASVTIAAGHLQNAGLIHYSRGTVTIVDRDGLKAVACECYRVVKDEFDRLLR